MAGKCGECTMCCKVLKIPELDKPKNKWCSHCDVGAGCKIYETRPEPCVEFQCVWLQTQDTPAMMEPALRPDRCKVVFVANAENEDMLNAHVDPGCPDAWRQEPVRGFIGAISHRAKIALTTGVRYWVIENGQALEARMSEEDENGVQWFKGYVRDEAK